MIIRRLIALLAVALVPLYAGQAVAQDASPAPPPDPFAPPADVAPFPEGGAGPLFVPPSPPGALRDACLRGFRPLRDEAERRGRLVKAATDRKAPMEEACKLVTSFGEAEIRLFNYVVTNAAKCAMPQPFVDQVKARRQTTEALRQKICGAPLVSDSGGCARDHRHLLPDYAAVESLQRDAATASNCASMNQRALEIDRKGGLLAERMVFRSPNPGLARPTAALLPQSAGC